MSDADDPAQEATNPAAQEATGTNPTQQQAESAAPAAGDLASLPEWAQQAIKELRREQAARRKQAQEAADAARQAEEKRLAESQQWQTLAEQRAAEIAGLRPVADRYEALSSEITAALEAEIKTWPAEVIALRPPDADAVALMTWAKTARPLAAKLANAGKPAAPGQGQPPPPAGQSDRAASERAKVAAAQVRNRF